jgi:hypothetical protein
MDKIKIIRTSSNDKIIDQQNNNLKSLYNRAKINTLIGENQNNTK